MPLRDFAVTFTILALLPICFARPWIGILVWSWIGYMNPHRLTWSFAFSLPFAMAVAIATIGGLLFTADRKPLPRTRETYLLMAFWGHMLVTTVLALYPAVAWDQFVKVSKILLMTVLTMMLMQEPARLRALFWVIGLSIGFYGFKGGLWALVTGGQNHVLGPPGTFISGNTEIGLALNMVLPIILYLRRDTRRVWLRHLLLATFCLSIVAILITYSRGALLALVAVLAVLFLKSRAKVIVLALVLVALPIASTTLPEQWFERMQTISTYEEDRSAMGRLSSWSLAFRIGLDYPIFGAGFRPFTPEIYARYLPEQPPRSADAHSIFFQVLAEHGFVGLGLYLAIIVSCLVSLRQIIRRTRGDAGARWLHDASVLLEACLIAFLVGGTFLSLSYFDLFFHLVALTAVMRTLAISGTVPPAPTPAPSLPARWRPVGV